MTAGEIVGITQTANGIRFTIDCTECGQDHGWEVYATEAAKAVRIGDFAWSQGRQLMWTAKGGQWKSDTVLYEVRRDFDGRVWPREDAIRGGKACGRERRGGIMSIDTVATSTCQKCGKPIEQWAFWIHTHRADRNSDHDSAPSACDTIESLRRERDEARAELAACRSLNDSLAARVAAQSELLTKRSEKL